jgi:carboxyl-terminal processing protease
LKEYSSYADTIDSLSERVFQQFLFYVAHRLPVGKEAEPEEVQKAVAVAEKEFEEVEKTWLGMSAAVDGKQDSNYARMIFRSIVLALDAHSDVLSESGAKVTRERLSKEAFGSGIICSTGVTGCRVTKVVKGSPADRLGEVFLNDEVTQINGRNVSEMSNEEIEDKLEDDANEVLTLTLVRTDPDGKISTLHISVPKRHYVLEEGRLLSELRSTPYGNILILNLYCFYHGKNCVSSQEDIKRVIAAAKTRGRLAGIILDFRDNGGGYITEAVRVVGLFIKTGVVMKSVYSDGTSLVFRDLDPNQSFSGPIIVLTSCFTASAAEIVVQALKDYGKAIVVGDSSTYGKGSIQMQTVTDVTEKGAWVHVPMRMTIGNFYTVSGFCPQGVGVKADIVLPSCSVRRAVEEPISGSRESVKEMFQDSLGDVTMQARGWYHEHYVPFIEQKTERFRKYIPQLRLKSSIRVENDAAFSSLVNTTVLDSMSEKQEQEVRAQQLNETVLIMTDLLEEISKEKQKP